VLEPEREDGSSLLAQLAAGTVIDGRYRVDEILGEGAMGVVVAAKHVQLGERVALKFLRYSSQGGDDDFRSRFRREAKVSGMLRNEHITRVIDVGIWRDRVPYMVMDYLAGTDLRLVIKREGPLPVARAVDLVVQVCIGISEAHAKGVVHRDLKPSNIFLVPRPDGSDLVKILDFGISKWAAGEADLDDLTKTGTILGSPNYMAPEQLVGNPRVDARADVWSIGAILYRLLSGRAPFESPSFPRLVAEVTSNRLPPALTAMRPEIPRDLEAVVMKCFARNRDQRIQNVAELAGGLLDAVHAPLAAAVRQRIDATLSMPTAEIPITIAIDEAPPARPSPTSPATVAAPPRRRMRLVIATIIVLLGEVAAFALLRESCR
jgi:eukaryotic-like serine/threonine-protein kinase